MKTKDLIEEIIIDLSKSKASLIEKQTITGKLHKIINQLDQPTIPSEVSQLLKLVDYIQECHGIDHFTSSECIVNYFFKWMQDQPIPSEEEILKLFPTNWLDPLLTGKDKVLGEPPYGCPDIEALLNAIKERIVKWMQDQPKDVTSDDY